MSWLSNVFKSNEPNQQQVKALNDFLKDFSISQAQHNKIEHKVDKLVGGIFLKNLDEKGQLNRKGFAQDLFSNKELNFRKDKAISGLGQKALKVASAQKELIESFESDYKNQMSGLDLHVAVENLKRLMIQPDKTGIANYILNQAANGNLSLHIAEALMHFNDIPDNLRKNLVAYCKVGEFGELQGKSPSERKNAADIIQNMNDPVLLKKHLTSVLEDNQMSKDFAELIANIAQIKLTEDVNTKPDINIKRAPAPMPVPQRRAPAQIPTASSEQKEITPATPDVVIAPTISKQEKPLTHEEVNSMSDTLFKCVDDNDKLRHNNTEALSDLKSVVSILLRMKGQSSKVILAFPELLALQSTLNKFDNILGANPSLAGITDVIKAEDVTALRKEYLSNL